MERQTLWNHNYQGDRRTLFWFGLYHISGTVFFCDFMARSWFQMTFYLGTARNYAWGSQMNYICKRSWSILVAMEQYCLLWINVLICSANGFELQYKCLMKQIKSRESHAIQSQKKLYHTYGGARRWRKNPRSTTSSSRCPKNQTQRVNRLIV